MVVELHVNNLGVSLSFWRDILGFQTAFERSEERFAYLEHPEGHQIMLCQRHGRFETGPLDPPLGQGAMFQMYSKALNRCCPASVGTTGQSISGRAKCGAGPEIARADREKFSCRTRTATC